MSGAIYRFDPRNGGHCYTAETRPDLAYGGRLAGAEEDAAILAAVVADAQATQSIHKEMIQHMVDWELRQPGILISDEYLRNAFVANLEGLRSAFTDRSLKTVGVMFPFQLDRANPAHAVVVAVRDDIDDTSSRLQQGRAQDLIGKRVQDAKISIPERITTTTLNTVRDLTDSLKNAVPNVAKPLGDAIGSLAWIVGGGFGIYLISKLIGSGK